MAQNGLGHKSSPCKLNLNADFNDNLQLSTNVVVLVSCDIRSSIMSSKINKKAVYTDNLYAFINQNGIRTNDIRIVVFKNAVLRISIYKKEPIRTG